MTAATPDERLIRAADPSGMFPAFAATASQLDLAYRSALQAPVAVPQTTRSVTVMAMGGSASAGDVVAAAFEDRMAAPIAVRRGYRVPATAGPDDVVVCLSYSGSTEETVAAHDAAVELGCTVVAVCGGGLLADRAGAAGTPLVTIPAEAPVPRAGLGALVGGFVGALAAAGLASGADQEVDEARSTLAELAAELAPEAPVDGNEARSVAAWVGDRMPVVWGSEGVSAAAAWRWKAAFNENAEIPAFSGVLPELSHHEVVGWSAGHGASFCLVILREPGEHPTVPRRLEATLAEMQASGLEWREVRARGRAPLARGMSLSLVGDLASAYHAVARGLDPASMEALVRVKERMSEGS